MTIQLKQTRKECNKFFLIFILMLLNLPIEKEISISKLVNKLKLEKRWCSLRSKMMGLESSKKTKGNFLSSLGH